MDAKYKYLFLFETIENVPSFERAPTEAGNYLFKVATKTNVGLS